MAVLEAHFISGRPVATKKPAEPNQNDEADPELDVEGVGRFYDRISLDGYSYRRSERSYGNIHSNQN